MGVEPNSFLEGLSEETKSRSVCINIQLRERRWRGTDISALDGDLLLLSCNLYNYFKSYFCLPFPTQLASNSSSFPHCSQESWQWDVFQEVLRILLLYTDVPLHGTEVP